MVKSFKYMVYPEEEDIIIEGEFGLTFYIIVSGAAAVLKDGIGKVATLGMGKSFGQLALQGNEKRNATVRAESRVEVITLHKLDYDRCILVLFLLFDFS